MAGLEVNEDIDLTNLDDKQKIVLLDKVFFKILTSENDLDFETNLNIFLPKLLLKLGTSEELVRKKVMEILVHINKRIKSRPNVQLPIEDLLEKFDQSAENDLPFVTNFSLIYIKLSFPRLEAKKKSEMIERLLNCLEGKSPTHQDSILSLIVDALKYIELKHSDSSNRQRFGLANSPKLRKYFLDYLFYFLLLPYSTSAPTIRPVAEPSPNGAESANNGAATAMEVSTPAPASPISETPACMSESIYKRFKADINLDNGDELEKMKIGILKFLAFDIYDGEEILFHFIISTSDTRYSVVQVAELHIKRITGTVDLSNAAIIGRAFHIFLGDKVYPKPDAKGAAVVEKNPNRLEPANTRIRLRLFPFILRSTGASATIPQAVQIVFDALFGSPASTNQKIKHYAIQFVHLIALNSDAERLNKIGAILVQGMNKLINEAKDDSKLRGLAYVAVGKLARKIPGTIASDISLVHSFFSALEKEDMDTKLHIQEALVLMIDAFRHSSAQQKNLLLSLLFQYVENDVSHCRSMSVKYAFEIYEHDQLESRYLLLLATSDSKEDIRSEAIKYLRRTQDSDGNELKIASFEDWVDFVAKKAHERLKTNYKCVSIGTHTLAFDVNCYQEVLVVLRLALSKSANLKAQIVDAKSLESIKEEAASIAVYINELSARNSNCLFKYVDIVKAYVLAVANPLGMYLLLEICSVCRLDITKFLFENIDWLRNQAFSVNEQLRIYSSELWSLVLINNILSKSATGGKTPEQLIANKCVDVNFDELFSNLIAINKANLQNPSRSVEVKHGSLLCIGNSLGKYYYLTKASILSESHRTHLKSLIINIAGCLDDANLSLVAIMALGEIARCGPLVFERRETLLTIVDLLNKKVLTSKEQNRLKEKAAATLGYLCIHKPCILESGGQSNEKEEERYVYQLDNENKDELVFNSLSRYIIKRLLNSAQAKQIELNMAIGDSLINCALGRFSTASANRWLVLEENESASAANAVQIDDQETQDNLEWLLNELLGSYMQSPNQHLRQSACFWLLIFIKKCARLSAIVSKNLYRIQEAFIMRLGEQDELTQEVASKAIGVIFSFATEEQQQQLVARLVDTLSGGNNAKKKQATAATAMESTLKVKDENEEIFQPGQIGKTPDGSNISTYKELCSLASDLNKPDLVYQFMNLAHHNSIWNTRRGAAFGFSTISQLASDQLQPYLSSIVPKLYRYQFDPNVKIQQSMVSIWNSVIKQDNKKIIDVYLKEILEDIEQNMHNPLWRTRESCCNALCDLLKGGRNLETISGKFGNFWSLLFKLVDDIKESVRASAELALKSLQRVTISYATAVSNASVCQQTINSVLPILIQHGLQSSLPEVRNTSVLTIRDLTKQSSSAFIKPYLVELIVANLEALSGYEPPDLNYISLKLNSQEAQEKLDMARISASKNTPMIEIINMNLQYLNDEQLLSEMIPRLLEIVKKGLGVSTKAGVCHIICSLVDQQPQQMAQYSGKIMAALVNSMSTEQNKTINKAYCNTIGCVVKVAKESSVENLINKLQDWYIEREEEGIKLSCGLTLLAVVQNNGEAISKFTKKCIPFVFFAMHQQTTQQLELEQLMQQQQLSQNRSLDMFSRTSQSNAAAASTVWDEVWEDITSGTEYAIRAHLGEILKFIGLGLEHQSWRLRMQAAMSICTITAKLQSSIEIVHLNEILRMLNAALNTRTWTGKEKILIAISCVFLNSKLILKIDNPLVEEMIKNVIKEANKQSDSIELKYRIYSLRCLSDLIQFSSSNFKDQYFEQYWSTFVLANFDKDVEELLKREKTRWEQQAVAFQPEDAKEAEQKKTTSDEKMAVDSSETPAVEKAEKMDAEDEEDEEEKRKAVLRPILLESFGKCWPYTTDKQETYLYSASLLLADYLNKSTWTNQLSIIKSMDILYDKWSIEFEPNNVDVALKSIEVCCAAVISCITKTKYSNLKRDGLGFLERIYKLLKNEKLNNENWNKLTRAETGANEVPRKFRVFVLNKIVEDLRVLFDEMSIDTNADIKDKAKLLLKQFNADF